MDPNISHWILEFLLRQPIENRVLKDLISILPIRTEDYFVLKSLLLRKISAELRKGLISEKILRCFEILEELDQLKGVEILDSMKEAYCGVAVDCSVQVFRENSNDFRGYYETLLRIWRGRVVGMEKFGGGCVGLLSDRLIESRYEIETALWDVGVRCGFMTRDTKNDAIKKVKDYMTEALEVMGPSYLELVSVERIKKLDGFGNVSIDNRVGEMCVRSSDVPQGALVENHANVLEDNDFVLEDRGPCLLDFSIEKGKEVEAQVNTSKEDLNVSITNHVGEKRPRSPDLFREDLDNNHRNVLEDNDLMLEERGPILLNLSVEKGKEVEAPACTSRANPIARAVKHKSSSTPEGTRVQEVLKSSCANSRKEVSGSVNVKSNENPITEAVKYNSTSTPEVIGVQEALKFKSPLTHEVTRVQEALRSSYAERRKEVSASTDVNTSKENVIEEAVKFKSPPTIEVTRVQEAIKASCAERRKEVAASINVSITNHVGETRVCSSDFPQEDLNDIHRNVLEDNGFMLEERGPIFVDLSVEKGKEVEAPVPTSKENPVAEAVKYKLVSTPEVKRVQKALYSSCAELHAAVKDPLPDALHMAENISSNMVRERVNHVPPTENPNGAHASECTHLVEEGAEAANATEGDTRNVNVGQARPSLMQRNATAHTYEWEDDTFASSCEELADRPRLQTPKRLACSPLKTAAIMARPLQAKVTGGARRKIKKWSSLEEQTLIDAVREHGRGNWKLILETYQEIFEERTCVDLKDKWRNMTK